MGKLLDTKSVQCYITSCIVVVSDDIMDQNAFGTSEVPL